MGKLYIFILIEFRNILNNMNYYFYFEFKIEVTIILFFFVLGIQYLNTLE